MLAQNYIQGTTTVNIARSIEDAAASGRIASGALLPPVRALASHLNVAPATVAAAYRLLQSRGLLVSEGRRGTRLRPAAPLSMPAEAPLPRGVVDLGNGNPDRTLLPPLPPIAGEQRLYGDSFNDPALLALARAQFAEDGVDGANISIVSGALDGIERVLREHLRPGDRVAVEDPCFTGVLDLLNALSLIAVPVALDDEGLLPDSLRPVLKNAQALIVTPRAQNPTGASLSTRRARELRRVLASFPDVLLLEDDHAGPVAGTPYVTLADRPRARWAVVRSVSKSLGPDLRVAVMATDAQTHARVEGRQRLGIRWVSHILQQCVVRLWRDRKTQTLLTRAARTYTQRRIALVNALAARGIASHAASGLNVWIPVAEESSVVQSLLSRGWAVKAGERYRISSAPAIRVTIASLDPADAARFAEDVAGIVKRRAGVTLTV